MKQNPLFFYLLLVLLAVAVASSCDKDDEVVPSMEGTITYDLPNFCYVGDIFDLKLEVNITDPTKDVEYFWRSTKDVILVDSLPGLDMFKMVIPDTIGTYDITAYAIAKDYNNRVNTKNVVAIDPNFNVSVKGIIKGTDSIVDTRDGIQYYIRKFGNLDWFVQNLRYAGTSGAPVGTSYDNEEVLSDILGRLYTWDEATKGTTSTGLAGGVTGGICPHGWSIPTKEDWVDFGKVLNGGSDIVKAENKTADEILDESYDNMWYGLGGKAVVEATLNGDDMWEYSYEIKRTNDYFWNGIPAGNSLEKDDRFENLFLYGMWWSGTEASSTEASYRYIFYNNTFFAPHEVSKTEFGASVRCVRRAI